MLLDDADDPMASLFRPKSAPFGAKGKKASRKKQLPKALGLEPAEAHSDMLEGAPPAQAAPVPEEELPTRPAAVRVHSPSAPLVAPPEEVLSEFFLAVTPERPASVPVRRVADDPMESPSAAPEWVDMWDEVPLESESTAAEGGASRSKAVLAEPSGSRYATLSELRAVAPLAGESSSSLVDVAAADARPMDAWFDALALPHLAAAARLVTASQPGHTMLCVAVEQFQGRERCLGVLARKCVDTSGRLSGYVYARELPQRIVMPLPWTCYLPTEARCDLVIQFEHLARRVRRLALA